MKSPSPVSPVSQVREVFEEGVCSTVSSVAGNTDRLPATRWVVSRGINTEIDLIVVGIHKVIICGHILRDVFHKTQGRIWLCEEVEVIKEIRCIVLFRKKSGMKSKNGLTFWILGAKWKGCGTYSMNECV